ncbi:hypothetical protein I3843_04G081800 [Carya illinoinensis]|uniref:Root meristem growth factor 9 n=1 Tax=Carya illinoinensis TaxID=32201 RepID=A0A8T1QT27_CARIL|nr:hypothetical protein I3760_04G088200 [Carya illinoinensis]KAG2711687.1 hypothetical protein I3760_04G088200 [Carya illinoinensis]KAG6657409.1 hypothetical protein CIPAW_04G088900 [Carya illinoinensis]KAG6717231.1 hypothetical protein I3842_04G087900 [Carya illinoinensis]KAG7983003.1 hypothetical protein I3843_04G081800 [Carya illinoinensis]
MATCKRLLLVAFVFLCFISITARARSLRAASNTNEAGPKGDVDDLFTPKEDGMEASSDELASMDYTPTTKKPPIHN